MGAPGSLSTGSSPDSSAWSQDFQNEALTLISGFLFCYFSDFFPVTLFFSSPTTSLFSTLDLRESPSSPLPFFVMVKTFRKENNDTSPLNDGTASVT